MADDVTSIILVAALLIIMVSPIPTSVLASGRYTALLSQPLKEGNQTGNNYLVLRLPLGIKIALSTSIVALIFLVYWVWKCFGKFCSYVFFFFMH